MQRYQQIFLFIVTAICFSISLYIQPAKAQWKTQLITLKPGWNSIYLEVEPIPEQCDEVFKDLPIESVWMWNPKKSPVRYIQDVNTLLPDQPEWMVYFPPSGPQSLLTNLFVVLGGRPYLIKLKGDQTIEWSLLGRPCLPKIDWRPNSFNFVGFHLNPLQEPTFQSFFASSPAHVDQDIYRLNENNIWEKISFPAASFMRVGEAYWVYCRGHSVYTGPMVCKVEQGDGLNFGKILMVQDFRVQNLTALEAKITLRTLNSKNPADAGQPLVAGDVPLLYWKFDPLQEFMGWIPLPETFTINTPPKQEELIRLAVKLADIAPTGLSQSILEITNSGGMRISVPVSAAGRAAGNTGSMRAKNGNGGFVFDGSLYAGLWVGTAVINQVSNPVECCKPIETQECTSVDCCPLIASFSGDPNCCPGEAGGQSCDANEDYWTTPTASNFQFRLIIHYGKKVEVDNAGNQASIDNEIKVRLLREVIQMWNKGTYELLYDPVYPDANEPVKVVKDPGHYVLLTDDSLIPQYNCSAMQSGKPVGRRISSAAFGFQKITTVDTEDVHGNPLKIQEVGEEPLEMHIDSSGTTLSCSLSIGPDDPLNPYKHKYHPDHDNLDPDKKPQYDSEENRLWEAYKITRDIKLEFTCKDPELPEDAPEGAESLGWGVTDIGGIYWERISGLHNHKIFIKGFFHLHRVSQTDTLTFPAP
ncbi:MAG: hypothetical protein ACMUIA_08850 [bacterium]